MIQSKKFIYIREVGPREGVQAFPQVISTEDKLKLIRLLDLANFPEIEVTALVRPDKVPQMADSDKILSELAPRSVGSYSALYLNDKGFLRSVGFSNILTQGWINSSVTETFLKKNNNQSFDEHLISISESAGIFKSNNCSLFGIMLSNSFGCNYEGAGSSKKLCTVLDKILTELQKTSSSPQYVVLADTTGMANPASITETIELLKKEYPNIKLGLHLHDTRGLGIANAYAGLNSGIDYFDSSIAGIGGCPFTPNATGNIATEELVYLCESLGFQTGINQEHLKSAAKLALQIFKGKTSSKLASTW